MLGLREIDADAYRTLVKPKNLVSTRIRVKQTDLLVSGTCDLGTEALPLVRQYRRHIEDYIACHPLFAKSFGPFEQDVNAPEIVKAMIQASARANVGPMAAVAGAIAEYVGLGLMPFSREVIVENGGDIFLFTSHKREMLLLAESSLFRGLRIALPPTHDPIGICTSSGILGHSFSFGRADAVMVVATSAAVADAAATSVGNLVKRSSDLDAAIERAKEIGVDGVVILVGDKMGAWGKVEILG